MGLANRLRVPKRLLLALTLATPLVTATTFEAAAAHINIVAIGGSNTIGKGVGSSYTYPAKLEAMLRAKGYDVSIANAGISGDASSGVLARLDTDIPNGTDIVILHTSRMNAANKGISPQQRLADIAEIMRRLRARNIKVIYIDKMVVDIPPSDIQGDHIHLTEQGHAIIASRLLPRVESAIGRAR